MTNEQVPAEELFHSVPDRILNEAEQIEVYLSENRAWLDITDWDQYSIVLDVPTARKLRDFLNEALPT